MYFENNIPVRYFIIMSVTWEIFGDNDDLRKLNNRYRMNKII
jgi:hypothetical protein